MFFSPVCLPSLHQILMTGTQNVCSNNSEFNIHFHLPRISSYSNTAHGSTRAVLNVVCIDDMNAHQWWMQFSRSGSMNWLWKE